MIALKPWKNGIPKRRRPPVYFGLSYVEGWLNPGWFLNGWEAGYVYAPDMPMNIPRLISLESVETKPMAEPMTTIFHTNIVRNIE